MTGEQILQYKIQEELGRGAMGVVYKAQDTKLQRTVVLKFLSSELAHEERARQRFIREARAAAALDHPNICTVYEIESDYEQPFIAMTYLRGETLQQLLERQGRLAVKQAVDIAGQIAQGLQHAHAQGVIHRDIKPANIIVDENGRVKITDFGMAKLLGGTKLTEVSTVLGTMAYMSPEQARGEQVDHRADIWALGVLLYEMITGVLPFPDEYEQAMLYALLHEEPEPVTALRPGIPSEIERLITRAMAKSQEQRYQSINAVIDDLKTIAASENIDGDSASPSTDQIARAQPESSARIEGTQIGAYKVIRKLGSGGMGDVYLATRSDQQFRQRVALKVLKRGMDSEEVLRRFRGERQILASLDHPNIARVLDGGLTHDGRPYFVLSYIEDALPIDKYCDHYKLSIAERLRMFREVCSAVQYAHQNLVIHRDLKPSNILVSRKGEIKLVDFGIAKLLNPELYNVTLAVTLTEIQAMTPEYASPEQLQGGQITTASDVYALGVLLYELLTGRSPYQFENRNRQAVASVICNTEPSRPSIIVRQTSEIRLADGATSTVSPASLSASRRTDTRKLYQELSSDLDNIVLMALEKDPHRRYATVEQLSEDIRRYLYEEPVIARKHTIGYRLQKFARRNRGAVLAACLVLLSLIGGLGTALWQAQQAGQQRDRAEHELAKSEAVTNFLMEMFKVSSPWQAPGESLTAEELLQRGVERAEELASQPEVYAELLSVIGTVYTDRGEFDKAKPLLERALAERRRLLGDAHPDIARNLSSLGVIMHYGGNYEAAQDYYEEALAMQRRLLGSEHQDIIDSIYLLAVLNSQKRNYETAERYFDEAIAMQQTLDKNHKMMSVLLSDKGALLRLKGDYQAAEPLLRKALAMQRKRLGDEHPDVARSVTQLARLLREKGEYADAEILFKEALAVKRKLLGDEHPDVALALNSLALLYREQGDLAGAEALFRQALELGNKVMGAKHPEVALTKERLALVLKERGDYAAAESLLLEALTFYEVEFGDTHELTTRMRSELAELYQAWGKPDIAVRYASDR